MKLREHAKKVAKAGRRGDSVLLHISPEELLALESSGKITKNPKTGMPEAWGLGSFTHFVQNVGNSVRNLIPNEIADPINRIADTAKNLTGNKLGIPGLDPKLMRGDFGHMAPVTKAAALAGGILLGGQALAGMGGNTAAYGPATGGLNPAVSGSPGLSASPGTLSGWDSAIFGTPAPATATPGLIATPGVTAAYDAATGLSTLPELTSLGTTASEASPAVYGTGTGVGLNPAAVGGGGGVGVNPAAGGGFAPQFDYSSSFGPVGAGDVGAGYGSYGEPSFWGRFRANPMLKYLSYASGGLGLAAGLGLMGSKAPPAAELYDPSAQARLDFQTKVGGPARDQLARLSSDPSYISQLPGYQAGLQAVQRSMAANGYLGSGNMMLALQGYGGKAYQDEFARLSALATGGMTGPMVIPQNTVDPRMQGLDIISRSLASLGYGAAL